MSEVFAFEVWLAGDQFSESHKYSTNARTAGQAKMDFMRMLDGCCGKLPWTKLRVKKIGGPKTSEQFVRNAVYRGLPEVRCGDPVRVGEAHGIIVGHNASANFDVLFDGDSPEYAGMRLNVHPSECVFATEVPA